MSAAVDTTVALTGILPAVMLASTVLTALAAGEARALLKLLLGFS
jgi:hypothetical protein